MKEKLRFPGYLSEEIKAFVGDAIIEEERDGIPVSGFFVQTLSNGVKMPYRGDWIIKEDGVIVDVLSEYELNQRINPQPHATQNDVK